MENGNGVHVASEEIELLDPSSNHITNGSTDEERSNEAHISESSRYKGVDHLLTNIGCGLFQVLAFILTGMSFVSFGAAVAVLAFINGPVTELWNLSAVEFAILPAVTSLANLIGAFFFGYIGDVYGRQWPYLCFLMLVSVFGMASAFSPSFKILIILRALTSLGIGGMQALVYPTLMEFLPIKHRGQTAILLMVTHSLGSTLIAGLSWILTPIFLDQTWRYLIVASSVPPILSVLYRIVFFFQSPRFLVGKGKLDAAWKVFNMMAIINRKRKATSETIRKEFIRKETKEPETKPQAFLVLSKFICIFKPPYLRRTLCLLVLKLGARFAYFNSTLFLPIILKQLLPEPRLSIFVAFIAQIPGIILMAIITEWPWFGRLNTLRLYTILAALFYFLFAFIQTEVTIPVFIVCIYFTMNSIVSMSYTYASESYPTEIRAIALGFLNTTQGLVGSGTRFVTGAITEVSKQLPWLFPSVWGTIYVVMLIVSLFLKREPQGKELSDNLDTGNNKKTENKCSK